MARIKISKVAKDLNVALPTVVEFLRGKNISVDDNPNARIEEDVVELLENAFKSDKDQKGKSQQLSTDRARDREKAKPAPREVEEIKLQSEINKPRIIGKIELDKHGNPVRPAAAPAQAAKPAVEPTPVKEPEPAPVAAHAIIKQEEPAPVEESKAPEPKETPAVTAEAKPEVESPKKTEQDSTPSEDRKPTEKNAPATQPVAENNATDKNIAEPAKKAVAE